MPKLFEERKRRKTLFTMAESLISVYNTHAELKIDGKEREEIRQLKIFLAAPKKADLDSIQVTCKTILELLADQSNRQKIQDLQTLQKILIEVPEDILADTNRTLQIIKQCTYNYSRQRKFSV